MKAYVVRLKEGEQNARELVGFFVTESIEQLYWLVDECAPPIDCEYREIDAGGVYWSRYTGHSIPLPPDFDFEAAPPDWSYLPAGAELSSAWEEAFHDRDDDENAEPWCPLEWEPPEDEDGGEVIERPARAVGAWRRRRGRR